MKKLANLRRDLRRAHESIKMFIPGSCDIGFLCSNIRIESKNASYAIELKNLDFETQVERHEEISTFEEVVENSPLGNKKVHTWLV